MKRIMIIFVVYIVLIAGSIFAEENSGYTISGEIMVLKSGIIYMQLLTEAQYQDKTDLSSVKQLIVTPTKEDVKANKVFFKIENAPSGVYTIQCYQDLNNNNKMDMGIMGFGMEPYAYYKAGKGFFGPPEFAKIKFELDQDLTDIKIMLVY